jgi:dienelactone hydrolase
MLISRGQIIAQLCAHIRANVPEFKLVKPYHGELDRYSKKVQLKENIFPAMVNMTTPFALIISKARERIEENGKSLRFKHDISIYIGDSNRHDFNNQDIPGIFSLMDKTVEALHGRSFIKAAGAMTLVNDGEYLITTDLFTIYDQKYYQLEIGL